ncbi:Hypothetical_protein [Hexamita inflata]|uniref:Hypothetical_protein n=1 Tax=Hexamita inflata TaxID=28002 RepID=A0AA86PQM1_9EUKA|nr:Hypothetical protein HINF_LOCUS32195 [Hexamita inflata]
MSEKEVILLPDMYQQRQYRQYLDNGLKTLLIHKTHKSKYRLELVKNRDQFYNNSIFNAEVSHSEPKSPIYATHSVKVSPILQKIVPNSSFSSINNQNVHSFNLEESIDPEPIDQPNQTQSIQQQNQQKQNYTQPSFKTINLEHKQINLDQINQHSNHFLKPEPVHELQITNQTEQTYEHRHFYFGGCSCNQNATDPDYMQLKMSQLNDSLKTRFQQVKDGSSVTNVSYTIQSSVPNTEMAKTKVTSKIHKEAPKQSPKQTVKTELKESKVQTETIPENIKTNLNQPEPKQIEQSNLEPQEHKITVKKINQSVEIQIDKLQKITLSFEDFIQQNEQQTSQPINQSLSFSNVKSVDSEYTTPAMKSQSVQAQLRLSKSQVLGTQMKASSKVKKILDEKDNNKDLIMYYNSHLIKMKADQMKNKHGLMGYYANRSLHYLKKPNPLKLTIPDMKGVTEKLQNLYKDIYDQK